MTTWKPIPGADGYEASGDGQVRGPRGALKPSKLTSGYLGIKLRGKGTTVHAAVACAFVGPRPSNTHTVNHKNGDKLDNRPDNLEWMTQAENNRHAVEVLGRSVGRPRRQRPVYPLPRPLLAIEIVLINHETGVVHRLQLCAPNRRTACSQYALVVDGAELGLSNKTAARDMVGTWMPKVLGKRHFA